jgi:Tfp pilus assembly protein FimV
MSAAVDLTAPEFAPDLRIAPCPAPSGPDATVLRLRPPADPASAPPLRLTRRGLLVVGAAVALLAGVLVWLAAASAPAAAPAREAGPATVTVVPGDTLWSIAGRVAPDRDPRAEVDRLRQLNQLAGAALVPGQVLRTR